MQPSEPLLTMTAVPEILNVVGGRGGPAVGRRRRARAGCLHCPTPARRRARRASQEFGRSLRDDKFIYISSKNLQRLLFYV